MAARKHSVHKVFPASFVGEGEEEKPRKERDQEVLELALFGSVAYTLKAGDQDGADWAGLARLVSEDRGRSWKFAYYRVYIQR